MNLPNAVVGAHIFILHDEDNKAGYPSAMMCTIKNSEWRGNLGWVHCASLYLQDRQSNEIFESLVYFQDIELRWNPRNFFVLDKSTPPAPKKGKKGSVEKAQENEEKTLKK